MDAAILILLAGTIFYAAKLSRNLKTFKESRQEIHNLIQDLSSQIVKADQAIISMKHAAKDSGRELQSTIDDAVAFRDELSLMNDAADRMASRLEGAGRNKPSEKKESIDRNDPAVGTNGQDADKGPKARIATTKDVIEENFPSFVIRDPEMEGDKDSASYQPEDENSDNMAEDDFYSEAERDLYNALVKSKAAKK
jgi:hypothetical protein